MWHHSYSCVLRVFFSDSALRFLVWLKVSRDFFLFSYALTRSSFFFAFFSSDSFFLSESASLNRWIKSSKTSSVSVCFGLIPLAFSSLLHFFLYFFTSKLYRSLTDLVVILKFISSREFRTTSISSVLLAPWLYL